MTPTARVVLVCPACGEALRVEHLPGPVACPNCFQPFPLAARSTVTRELESPPEPGDVPVPRPFLLTAWMGIGLLNAARMVLILLVTAGGSRPLGDDGRGIAAGAYLLGYFLTIAVTLLSIAGVFGIWKERRWTRRVLVATWLAIVAGIAVSVVSLPIASAGVVYPRNFTRLALASRAISVLLPLAGLAATWWYLYRKPNVVAYFDAIGRGRRPAGPRRRNVPYVPSAPTCRRAPAAPPSPAPPSPAPARPARRPSPPSWSS